MSGTCTKREGKRGVTWWGRYWFLDSATDRLAFRRVTARTKTECQNKIADAMTKINAGALPKNEKLSVADFFAQWLAVHESQVRATTHRRYRGIVHNHVLPTLGAKKLTALTALDLQRRYDQMRAAGATPAAIAYTHTVIRTGLNQAVRWGLLDRNVATLVRPPRVTVAEFTTWTRDEVSQVFAVTDETDLAAFWRVALLCGLRRGELLGLWWEDVDLEGRTLAVRRTMFKGTAGWELGPPKTVSSRRSVALPDSCVVALTNLRDRQLFQRQRRGELWAAGPSFVFTNATGGPLHVNTVARQFQRISQAAGVPVIRLHDTRHTCATLMLQAGVHPKVVSEMLGHAGIQVTLDRYSHIVPSMQRAAADALDRVIAGNEIVTKLPQLG